MIEIEINGQRETFASEIDAKRALSKAWRAAKKADAIRQANYDLAHRAAKANGFDILAKVVAGERCPRAWILYRPQDRWASSLFTTRVACIDVPEVVLNCEKGQVVHRHYGYRLAGAVCNGSGYCRLVVLADETTNETTVYAVGVYEGVYALVALPGVTPDWFAAADRD